MTVVDGHEGCLTLFSLVGMSVTGFSVQNVSSTSMDWGAFLPCNASLLSTLGCLPALFLGFGRLAVAVTSTGTSLVPREYTQVSHSTTLAFDLRRQGFTPFIVSLFRAMEKWIGCVFLRFAIKGSDTSN